MYAAVVACVLVVPAEYAGASSGSGNHTQHDYLSPPPDADDS